MFSTELRRIGVWTAVAMGATTLCWLVVRQSGVDLAVRAGAASVPTPVPWGAVLLATAAGGGGAFALVRLANRTSRPSRAFALAVVAGFLITCIPPLQAAGTVGTLVGLMAMHLVAAAVLVPCAAQLLRPAERRWSIVRDGRSTSSGSQR